MYACKISSIYTEKIKIKCWISKAGEGNIELNEKSTTNKKSRRVKRKESNSNIISRIKGKKIKNNPVSLS